MKGIQRKIGQATEIDYIVWVRAISVFLILLCHLTQTHHSPYVVMTSQIFNVGVNIFLIISGFLFGYRGISCSYGKWFVRRVERIFVPYWLFLLALISVLLLGNVELARDSVVRSFLGIHGFAHVLPGAQHTWFISAILLCYVLTPLVDLLTEWAKKEKPKKRWGILFCAWIVLLMAIAPLDKAPFLTTCPFYMLAYAMGKLWKQDWVSCRCANIGIFCVVSAFILRFGARLVLDDTLLYNHVIALYTHYAAAFGFFFAAAWFLNRKPRKIIRLINDLSFEIYLVHYMFVWSPISVMNATNMWMINCVLVIVLSIAAAALLRLLVSGVQRIYKTGA